MPRPVCGVVVILVAALCGQAGIAQAQFRGIGAAPMAPIAPVRVAPITGPALPAASLNPSVGSGVRLNTSNLSVTSSPRVENPAPSVRELGGTSRPTEEVFPPGQEEKAAVERSPSVPKAGSGPGGAGGGGDGDGGGDDGGANGPGGLAWVKDLPGWVWVVVVLVILAWLGSRD